MLRSPWRVPLCRGVLDAPLCAPRPGVVAVGAGLSTALVLQPFGSPCQDPPPPPPAINGSVNHRRRRHHFRRDNYSTFQNKPTYDNVIEKNVIATLFL